MGVPINSPAGEIGRYFKQNHRPSIRKINKRNKYKNYDNFYYNPSYKKNLSQHCEIKTAYLGVFDVHVSHVYFGMYPSVANYGLPQSEEITTPAALFIVYYYYH